ncbi:baseplate J/gp47 family protein [Rhodohalobacter sp. 8-1]|uniref:baseplate J/gp47 family protein n=1 Tax=Rhodohalobacter sp. 8-1 TaxID=3131972 RepID=UPI0030EF1428
MSDNCRHSNLLKRSGTSQQDRLLKALLPDYVAVDERKIEDLKSFVREYAKQIQYYDYNQDPDETRPDWESFFDKKIDPDRYTEPHYALFMAFLQLFKIARDDLNQITRKHLNFYYRDVLQLREKQPVPDQVFLIFELAKHAEQHRVEKGTQLKAGKDESGVELIYQTDREIVLNDAEVANLKAVFKDKKADSKDENSRIYASPVANSADGEGAEIESSEMNWRTFGKPLGEWPDQDRTQAEVGFAFASPLLFLAEGEREITITLTLKENNSNTLSEELKELNLREAFRVQFSGEEEWIEPLSYDETTESEGVSTEVAERIFNFLNRAETWQDIAGVEPQAGPVFDDPTTGHSGSRPGYDIGKKTADEILKYRKDESKLPSGQFESLEEVRTVPGVGEDKINDLIYTFRNPVNQTTVDPGKRQIIIRRTITKAQDPIVKYIQNDDALTDPFDTNWPVVKITLRTDQDPYLYSVLKKFEVEKADLSVHVSEVRELIVQNDQTVLDPGGDFQPFGMRPVKGSNFYIGSREVFSKKLDELKIHLKWHDLPDDENGFEGHYDLYNGASRTNDSFRTDLFMLDQKKWKPLFTEPASSPLFHQDDGLLSEDHVISVKDSEKLQKVQRDPILQEADSFDTHTRKGFLKMVLAGPDFGHKDFQPSYSKAVMNALQPDGTFTDDPPLPNEPYTPVLKEIFLTYQSSAEIDLTNNSSEIEKTQAYEQFFHVGPFGVSEQRKVNNSTPVKLYPQIDSEGSLYIGLENFTAGRTLALLFQVAEGSADPDLEPQPVRWSYLSDNRWINFEPFDILSDSTSGLLASGIIRFSVPKRASDQNSILPAGLHWLRATVKEDSDAVSDIIQISAQAVTATFKDQDNDPGHLKEALPAETISKLKNADSAIGGIEQPFSSFGGSTKEKQSDFYTRVSERLRHKKRAITIWDYERLVLEEFPSVYKAKCLNHTRYTGSLSAYSELAPGHVTLVVISNVRNKNAVDPLRPKTSLITLTNISQFLSGINSSCVNLHVKNPIYEEIKVKLNVKFYEGFDNGFYGKQLEDDLKGFLSPWAVDAGSTLELGGTIHKSVILNYVEERTYVDFVTCFEIWHIIFDPATDEEISRKNVNQAEASTAVSILGSTGQMGRYGDHDITVLESDDCECTGNEIQTTATIASADDCGCEEDQQFKT